MKKVVESFSILHSHNRVKDDVPNNQNADIRQNNKESPNKVFLFIYNEFIIFIGHKKNQMLRIISKTYRITFNGIITVSTPIKITHVLLCRKRKEYM